MFKNREKNKGYTLIELLVVAAVIGILLAIAIPNWIKARISANEANARKAMQTLRDAEGEFFEQDMDGNGNLDYVDRIGSLGTSPSLRDPEGTSVENDALIDNSFEGAVGSADTDPGTADCDNSGGMDPKAGYCIGFSTKGGDITPTGNVADDFGWVTSMTSFRKNGRKDFAVYADGVIRCTLSGTTTLGLPGDFNADHISGACE
ncbi:MAG: type IV pilin protein [Thermodesulfobacteriota bacterium]